MIVSVLIAKWGCHINDTLDQFRVFEFGHGLPAAEELIASQAIAIAQRRGRCVSGRGHRGDLQVESISG